MSRKDFFHDVVVFLVMELNDTQLDAHIWQNIFVYFSQPSFSVNWKLWAWWTLNRVHWLWWMQTTNTLDNVAWLVSTSARWQVQKRYTFIWSIDPSFFSTRVASFLLVFVKQGLNEAQKQSYEFWFANENG